MWHRVSLVHRRRHACQILIDSRSQSCAVSGGGRRAGNGDPPILSLHRSLVGRVRRGSNRESLASCRKAGCRNGAAQSCGCVARPMQPDSSDLAIICLCLLLCTVSECTPSKSAHAMLPIEPTDGGGLR